MRSCDVCISDEEGLLDSSSELPSPTASCQGSKSGAQEVVAAETVRDVSHMTFFFFFFFFLQKERFLTSFF